jgi:hypothetical protein
MLHVHATKDDPKSYPVPNNTRPRYIFICSAGHSGSTLLDLLIGGNREVESLGEITHFPKNVALNTVCTCGKPVQACELWCTVIADLSHDMGKSLASAPYGLDLGFIDAPVVRDKAHQTPWYRLRQKFLLGSDYFSLRTKLPSPPGVRRYFDRVIDNNYRLYEAVLRKTGKSVVTDSSKSYLKAIGFYRQHPASTRIIVLFRDGRGVFYSGLNRGVSRRAAYDAWGHHYDRAIPLYRNYVAPEHITYLQYESLAARPEQELRRICKFLGLTYDDAMLRMSDTESHITDGNNMRFTRGQIRLDEKWRTGLNANDARYFDARGGRLNALLGYKK